MNRVNYIRSKFAFSSSNHANQRCLSLGFKNVIRKIFYTVHTCTAPPPQLLVGRSMPPISLSQVLRSDDTVGLGRRTYDKKLRD